MDSPRSTARRRRGLFAVATAVAMSAMMTTGSLSAGAVLRPGGDVARRNAPVPGELCGNLLLRHGTQFVPLGRPAHAAPDPRATVYSGINNRRQLVGGYYVAGVTPDARGFYPDDAHRAVVTDRKARRHRSVDVPGALITLAYALNDRTQVVGQYIDEGAVPDAQGRLPAGSVHGFLWHRDEFATIDVPGAPLTQPLGINNRGEIVGADMEADVDPDDPYAYYDTGRLRGFVLRHGEFTPVDFPGGQGTKVSGINDHGQMVGYYDTPEARRGFVLKGGRFTEIDPPGSLTTLPSGIDKRGRVVGAYLDANGINGRGFIWKKGRYTTIIAPGARTDSIALDINDRGDILIPADGTYYRQPEIACGKPTTPANPAQAAAPSRAEPDPTATLPAVDGMS
jgi:uncharacterized membrane protein